MTYRKKKTALAHLARTAALTLPLLIPLTASAGLLSIVSNFFGAPAAAQQATASEGPIQNSQTMSLLQAARNIDPNPSKGGGDITIVSGSALLPESGPAGTLADIEEHRNDHGQISLYVVREGDSLSQIAQMFGVSTNTIIWANDIKRGTLITPGQHLIILPISGVRYTVEKGDTLASIAKDYKGNLEEILQFNGLSADASLSVGDIVIIPDGEVSTAVYGSSASVATGSGGPSYSGYYLRPVVGGRKTQGIHGYNGVDIAAPTGTEILAAASGTVIISRGWGWNGGYGGYIVVRHENGTQTLYAHNSQNIVSVGQWVVKGQVIGYVGSTGRSTGPHLHFEIRGARNPF